MIAVLRKPWRKLVLVKKVWLKKQCDCEINCYLGIQFLFPWYIEFIIIQNACAICPIKAFTCIMHSALYWTFDSGVVTTIIWNWLISKFFCFVFNKYTLSCMKHLYWLWNKERYQNEMMYCNHFFFARLFAIVSIYEISILFGICQLLERWKQFCKAHFSQISRNKRKILINYLWHVSY